MFPRSLRGTSSTPRDPSRSSALSRRNFLIGSTILAGAVAGFGDAGAAFAATNTASDDMVSLTSLMAGKDVDPVLVGRAVKAITENDANFPKAAAALVDFVKQNKIADSDALTQAAGYDGDLKTTAQTLLKAVYLGYTGEPQAVSAEDNVKFIAFENALSFQVTKPYVPVPSYSRWRSGYWAHLPEAG